MYVLPFSSVTSRLPKIRLKMTRNISGKTMVKKAAAGFRQKALFS